MLQHIGSLRRCFAQGGESNALSDVLSADVLERAVSEEVGAYRERIYSPLQTLSMFVLQNLSADGACQDAVARGLSQRVCEGRAACSVNTGPYCKARQRMPEGLVWRLLRDVGQRLTQNSPHWNFRGRVVKIVDGTTVSMPDTVANQARYPQNAEQKPGLGFPIARVVALLSWSSGALTDAALGPYQGKETGEHALLRELLPRLTAGEVRVGDHYYGTYFLLVQLKERGIDSIFGKHGARKSDFRTGRRLGSKDHVVIWKKPKRPAWMDAATYARIADTLEVREVKARGHVIVSTLTDAKQASKAELGELYAGRWSVELDLRSIKSVLGMDLLRCKTPDMVEKEIAVYLLGYNLIRAVMARAAARAHRVPRQLSFKGALQLWSAFADGLRRASAALGCILREHLWAGIARLRVGQRPGRHEPRAIKRRPKPTPLLRVPRTIARQKLAEKYARVCA
ncbi:MAG: IS4 family transposase [Gammaproteobacteria bacterium]|nr:IS4 family transposase [Gammaproteobacteria bacterium]